MAQALQEAGAEIVLVSAPTDLPAPQGVTRVSEQTALEMHDEVLSRFEDMDVVVVAAAVADYRPAVQAEQKIKKDGTSRNRASSQSGYISRTWTEEDVSSFN